MADHASVGFWVRRFLSEHLVHERGVSRNTQQSYRDTFCLFLPFVAAQRKQRLISS
jgi:integrase/recombinase XerD